MHVHTVLLKLADAGDRDRCRAEMLRLDGAIPGMIGLELVLNEFDGANAADIALTTRWADADAYRAYDSHPLHVEVRAAILPLISDISVIDYTVADPAG